MFYYYKYAKLSKKNLQILENQAKKFEIKKLKR